MTEKIVKLKIHEESDLYSSFDPDQNLLSDEVIGYLTRVFLNKHRLPREKYVLSIISDLPVNEERVKEKIRGELELKKDDLGYAVKRLTLKEICLGILGVIILSVWLYLSAKAENVNVEILSIIGWVTIWEAATIALIERPEMLRVRKNVVNLLNIEIRTETAKDNGNKD